MSWLRIARALAVLAPALLLGVLSLPDARLSAQTPVYIATLTGDQANPPNDSDAVGTFVAYRVGDVLEFELQVPEITGATAVTLHLGGPGEEGERIAFLFRPAAPSVEDASERERQLGGEFDIVSSLNIRARITPEIGCGFICAAELIGSLTGDIEGLIDALNAENAYIIVLTKEYRDGEIRGQVRVSDVQDHRVRALADDGTDPAGDATEPNAAFDDDEGFPAWAWAMVIGTVAVVILAGAQFRPARRP